MALPVFRSASETTALLGTEPAGAALGDVLVALVKATVAPTGPAGWTQVGGNCVAGGQTSNYWVIVRGSSAPSYQWGGGGITVENDIVCYSSASLTQPNVGASGGNASTSSPAVTTNQPNCMLVSGMADRLSTTVTVPAGTTKRSAGVRASIAELALATAQTTSAQAWGSTTAPIGAFTVALSPLTAVVTSDVTSAAALTVPEHQDVTTTASLSTPSHVTSDVTTAASISTPNYHSRDVTSAAALKAPATIDLPTSASLSIPPKPLPPTAADIEMALAGAGGAESHDMSFEWRSNLNTFMADVTPAVEAWKLDLDNTRDICRDATFTINPQTLPLSFSANSANVAIFARQLVKGVVIPIQMALVRLDLSEEDIYATDDLWMASGSDLTIMLQQSTLEDAYTLPAGSNIIQAIEAHCDSVGLAHSFPASPAIAPVDWPWNPNTTRLQIVNDLLDGLNWFHIFTDQFGVATSRLMVAPEQEFPSVTYRSGNEPRLVIEPFRRVQNTGTVSNIYSAQVTDVRRGLLFSTFENDDPTSPASSLNTATQRSDVIFDKAPDAATLAVIADFHLRLNACLAQPGLLTTDWDPRRVAHESYTLRIDGIEDGTLWRCQTWSLDGTSGVVTHTLVKTGLIALTPVGLH